MDIGSLNERIKILERVSNDDGIGGYIITWDEIGEVWANVEPISTPKAILTDNFKKQVECIKIEIRPRYLPKVFMVEYRGKNYEVQSVYRIENRKKITIECCG
jgi:SPP1 family predicted phage head-tail adaptor